MSSKSLNIRLGYKQTSRIKFSVTMFLSMFFMYLMGFQLIRTMEIDAYQLGQTRVDLLGYWLGLLLSGILTLWLLIKRRAMVISIFMVMVLLVYISAVHTLTVSSDSPIGLMFSRYGLLMWFVLGLGFSVVLEVFHERKNLPSTKFSILLMLGILALYASHFAVKIIQFPVITLSYQSVASSAIILLLMFACILNVVWARAMPLHLVCLFISFTTIISAAVVLLQSTGIAVIWLSLVVIFFGEKIIDSRLITKLAMVIIILILAFVFIQSATFEMILTTTRFASFYLSDGELTSLTSRLEILRTFMHQFEVSPIFGHFKAQVVAGYYEGRFIHSLPLSFLTHTGLIGTSLVCVILFNLLYVRNPWRNGLEFSEKKLFVLMCVVLVLGSISTFLTWAVFWFFLGVLCRRPAKKII